MLPLAGTAVFAIVCAVAVPDRPQFDLLITGGKVYDGSGGSPQDADVAIANGRIVAVGPRLSGRARRRIDAHGLAVAPGFIDVHTHSEDILRIPRAENFVRQGVTTVVTGNCGSSADDIGEFLHKVDEVRPSLNVATLVGHNTVRKAAMGGSFDRPPTADELSRMVALVDKAMADGACGLSTGLIYLPGVFSRPEEIVALARAAAAHGGIYTSHMRSEGDRILDALDEVFRVGRDAGIRVEVSHIKLAGNQNWGRAGEVLAAIAAARASGVDVAQDQYAYTASSTGVAQLIPAWAREGGADAFRDRLKDPVQKARMVDEMRTSLGRRGKTSYDYVTITSFAKDRALNGMSLPDATRLRRGSESFEAQVEMLFDIQLRGGAGGVFHGISEGDLQTFMRDPFTSFASDAGPRRRTAEVPHPRGFGNNARVLGRYVRELGVLSLQEAVRRMTSLPASRFRLMGRGELREGAWADVVVFDPKVVSDTATYSQPYSYAAGVVHVVVNGVPVVRAGRHTGARSGKALPHARG